MSQKIIKCICFSSLTTAFSFSWSEIQLSSNKQGTCMLSHFWHRLVILKDTSLKKDGTIKGDLRTICRFSYMKVYKLITLGTKFKTLLSLGRKITMFSKFITNYIEQGWWHSSLTLKCMHLLLKEVNKRGRHAYNLHGWTCLPSGIVMEITLPHNWNFWGCCEAEAAILLFSVICSWFSKVLLFVFVTKINSQTF